VFFWYDYHFRFISTEMVLWLYQAVMMAFGRFTACLVCFVVTMLFHLHLYLHQSPPRQALHKASTLYCQVMMLCNYLLISFVLNLKSHLGYSFWTMPQDSNRLVPIYFKHTVCTQWNNDLNKPIFLTFWFQMMTIHQCHLWNFLQMESIY